MARTQRKPPAGSRADYLQRILTARVYDVAQETPLEHARALSRRLGNHVLLKREDQQSVFSFKLRGAYNKMANLTAAERARGVIAASAGNHAQGVALAAKRLGCRAVVVMPVTTPRVKVDAVQALGGEVVLHGDSYSDAYAHALTLQRKQRLSFVHPFDDPDVIAGQGTVGMEILRQHQGPLDAVFVAVGGGGLIGGIAAWTQGRKRVIGVEPELAPTLTRALAAGEPVDAPAGGIAADSLAPRRIGTLAFEVAKQHVERTVLVSDDAIVDAQRALWRVLRVVVEPGGAAAMAALLSGVVQAERGETVGVLLCGANTTAVSFD